MIIYLSFYNTGIVEDCLQLLLTNTPCHHFVFAADSISFILLKSNTLSVKVPGQGRQETWGRSEQLEESVIPVNALSINL